MDVRVVCEQGVAYVAASDYHRLLRELFRYIYEGGPSPIKMMGCVVDRFVNSGASRLEIKYDSIADDVVVGVYDRSYVHFFGGAKVADRECVRKVLYNALSGLEVVLVRDGIDWYKFVIEAHTDKWQKEMYKLPTKPPAKGVPPCPTGKRVEQPTVTVPARQKVPMDCEFCSFIDSEPSLSPLLSLGSPVWDWK